MTVTYTDVHLARAKFFTDLFRNFSVQWSGLDRKSAEGLGDEGVFYLVTGRCPTDGGNSRDVFLEAVGASAGLPDRLEQGAQDPAGVGVAERCGPYPRLGGSAPVWPPRLSRARRQRTRRARPFVNAAPTRIGFGERLDHALGRDAAVDFLKTVLRVSTEALLHGRSVRLVRDRIEADLVRHLERVDSTLLAIVIRQAGLAREVASEIARYVAGQRAGRRWTRALWPRALAVSRRRLTGSPLKRATRLRGSTRGRSSSN